MQHLAFTMKGISREVERQFNKAVAMLNKSKEADMVSQSAAGLRSREGGRDGHGDAMEWGAMAVG